MMRAGTPVFRLTFAWALALAASALTFAGPVYAALHRTPGSGGSDFAHYAPLVHDPLSAEGEGPFPYRQIALQIAHALRVLPIVYAQPGTPKAMLVAHQALVLANAVGFIMGAALLSALGVGALRWPLRAVVLAPLVLAASFPSFVWALDGTVEGLNFFGACALAAALLAASRRQRLIALIAFAAFVVAQREVLAIVGLCAALGAPAQQSLKRALAVTSAGALGAHLVWRGVLWPHAGYEHQVSAAAWLSNLPVLWQSALQALPTFPAQVVAFQTPALLCVLVYASRRGDRESEGTAVPALAWGRFLLLTGLVLIVTGAQFGIGNNTGRLLFLLAPFTILWLAHQLCGARESKQQT